MKNEIKSKMKVFSRFAVLPAIAFSALILIFAGCMETSHPEDTESHELNVRVFQVIDGDLENRVPIRNAEVNVVPTGDALASAVTKMTNAQGNAEFELVTPLIGQNYDIYATYNNVTQTKQDILLCRDTLVVFVFDTTLSANTDCGNLDGADSLIFRDDLGNRQILQNTPPGSNRYERCWTLSNSAANTETITATIPAVDDPFELISIIVAGEEVPLNSQTVEIPPGAGMTVCYSVRTDNAGIFDQTINFALSCANSSGNYSLSLHAEIVEPECNCENIPENIIIELPDRVQVGQNITHSEVIYTNELACDASVDFSFVNNTGSWEILNPDFPVNLPQGESLTLEVRFSPQRAGGDTATAQLTVIPAGSGEECIIDVELRGNSCNNVCPEIGRTPVRFEAFGSQRYVDTLSNRTDNRVFVSYDDPRLGLSQVIERYYIQNPDTACDEITVNIAVNYADQYAREYFEVRPEFINLAPGDIESFEVIFTAPYIEEFEQITAARGNTGALTDSLFKISLVLSSAGCRHEIEDNAVVTTYPEISPIINLRAYNQRTPQKDEPENEVYIFGNDSRTINKGPGGTPGEFPPEFGDIYIDVNNNDPSAQPPQEPILKLVDNAIGMKVWRNNYTEADFTNVGVLINDFANDPNYSTGYSTNDITNINVQDVIAFKFSDNVYALIFIRRVDNGTENTSSRQSGIEFRSVYPIRINP